MGLTPEAIAALKVPFPPDLVEWRPGATSGSNGIGWCYADPRAYSARLSEIDPDWTVSYRWEDGHVFCVLTVMGVTREEIGDIDEPHSSGGESTRKDNSGTSAIAQSFKRACATFGLGADFYFVPTVWVETKGNKFTDESLATLNRVYARFVELLNTMPRVDAIRKLRGEVSSLKSAHASNHSTSTSQAAPEKSAQWTAPTNLPEFWKWVSWEWAKAVNVDADSARKYAGEVLAEMGQDITKTFEKMAIEAAGSTKQLAAAVDETEQESSQEPSEKMCPVHEVMMPRRISKKTGKPYYGHNDESTGGQWCFGR